LSRGSIAARLALCVALAALFAGCSEVAHLPLSAGIGPDPQLPEPHPTLIPTVNVAPAKGWAAGEKPGAVAGTQVAAFATGLAHPRWVYVLPNGDVLVAETNAPPTPDDNKGIKAWFTRAFMKRAGAAAPSADRITLLRDVDGDGVPEVRTVFLEGLHSPFGMALIGNDFYVANSDAVVRFPITRVKPHHGPGTLVTSLPAGPSTTTGRRT
jgi:glucose/arabinose dehydrogenase